MKSVTNSRKQRIASILKVAEAQGFIEVPEVSEMTIRRDLNELASLGLVKRVSSGAIPLRRKKTSPKSRPLHRLYIE